MELLRDTARRHVAVQVLLDFGLPCPLLKKCHLMRGKDQPLARLLVHEEISVSIVVTISLSLIAKVFASNLVSLVSSMKSCRV